MTEKIPEEDSTQELLAEYQSRWRGRSDDAPAMQLAVCAVIAAAVFLLNTAFSGTAAEILRMINEFSGDSAELFPNPAEFFGGLF